MSDVQRFWIWKLFIINLQQISHRMRLKQKDISNTYEIWVFEKKESFFEKKLEFFENGKGGKFVVEFVWNKIVF